MNLLGIVVAFAFLAISALAFIAVIDILFRRSRRHTANLGDAEERATRPKLMRLLSAAPRNRRCTSSAPDTQRLHKAHEHSAAVRK
jgi:type II secretory pathway component PulJ